jgi:predicted dehydrogenase
MTTRRNFIKNLALGATTMTVGSVMPGLSAKSYKSIVGANEKVRVGVMGVNARGLALTKGFAYEKSYEVTHICDVDSRASQKAVSEVTKIAGNKPKAESDIRRLLESNDFDVLAIAAPDHWHAPAAIMAMQAGKHVYLEKPTSHNPAENELLIKAAAKYNRVVQVGNQRRSWPNIIRAINEIKSGVIGKVSYGKGWYTNNRPSIGVGKITSVPGWLDWELWQGPAPRVKNFKDNYLHYNWHWFWHWGTGEALNNGIHFVDLLRWGMEVDYPTMVTSVGGRYRYQDDWETPDTQVITYQFGNEKTISWESRSCNSSTVEGYASGVIFYGDKGRIIMSGGNEYKVYDLQNKLIKHITSDMGFEERNLINPTQGLDVFHFRNLMDGIKNGAKLNSDIVNACISTQLMQLGNISHRVGRSLHVDPHSGRVLKDKAAEKYWSRTYEKGWEIKL